MFRKTNRFFSFFSVKNEILYFAFGIEKKLESCEEHCVGILCRLRKKFNSKFEIDKSSDKIRNLYQSKKITQVLTYYKRGFDEFYKKPRKFSKIDKKYIIRNLDF